MGFKKPNMLETFGGEDAARGLLVTLLHLFNTDGGDFLSRDEFSTGAKALGYDTSDEAWHSLCMRFWSSSQATETGEQNEVQLDLSNVAYHFRNKYDHLLEEILRQALRGITTLHERCDQLQKVRHLMIVLRSKSQYPFQAFTILDSSFALSQDMVAMQGAAERDRKRKIELVLRRMQNELVAKAFDGWTKMAKGQIELRNRIARRWANETLYRMFCQWRELCNDGKDREQILNNTLMRMKHRTVALAFESWLQLLQNLRRKQATAERAFLRLLNALLAKAYTAWQGMVNEAKRHRELLLKVRGRMQNRAAAQAFTAWAFMVTDVRRQREAVAKVLGKMRNRVAAEAFVAWHEVAVHALTARDNALRHAANTLVQRTVYFAFLTWREQIEHKKQVVGRAKHLAGRMLHELTGRCFDAWYTFVQEQQRIFRQAAHAIGPGRMMWIAYRTWAENVRDAVAEREREQQRLFMLSSLDERLASHISSTIQTELIVQLPLHITTHIMSNPNPMREAIEELQISLNSRMNGLQEVRLAPQPQSVASVSLNRPTPPSSAQSTQFTPLLFLNCYVT